MAKSENFTVGKIEKFTCPPGKKQEIYWDTKAPGLCCRVTPGAKSYVFESRLFGKTIRITIGDVRTWPLDGPSGTPSARAEATRLKTLINQGIDPRQQKIELQKKAEELAAEAVYRNEKAINIWRTYIDARKVKWSASHLADHEKVIQEGGEKRKRGWRPGESRLTQPGAMLQLLSRPLTEIDEDTIKSWLTAEVARRPTHARLCFILLRAFLNWCGEQKEYQKFANADVCGLKSIKEVLAKKVAKDDCLQREQLSIWFAEVKKLPPVLSAYLQCVLLVGARRNELTGLRWEDVDFKWQSLTLHDKDESKGGEDGTRTIPLTPYVASLLRDLKKRNETPPPSHRILNGKKIENDLENWKPSKFVFFSRSASGHIEEPRSAHNRALKAAGLPSISIHGLRRSFATLSEWTETPEGAVAQIQGHKPSGTREKHYKTRPLDLLRLWHVKIEAWILEQAGIKQPKAETAPSTMKAVA